MRRLQLQFLISYATFGSIGPLLPVFLKEERGFTEFEIGVNQCLTSLATVISPPLITFLADRKVDARRILPIAFLISATAFALLHSTSGVWSMLAIYMMHSLVYIPAIALQDGYFFASNQGRVLSGLPSKTYNQVRAWGSVGFVLPSLALFVLLGAGAPKTIILLFAMSFALLSCLHSFRLPHLGVPSVRDRPAKGPAPTLQALRMLAGPSGRFFCLGMILALSASFPYHGFFSLYLKRVVGVPVRAVGLVFNLGVFLEIFYILALSKLLRRWGIRRLMLLGLAAMCARYILLAKFPTIPTAIAVQFIHGFEICAAFVLPTMYLNSLAGDEFRNSIQGVYIMFVVGGSRVVATLVAGKIAQASLIGLFHYGAVLAALAFGVFFFFFRPKTEAGHPPPA